jgi:hypothetical protein
VIVGAGIRVAAGIAVEEGDPVIPEEVITGDTGLAAGRPHADRKNNIAGKNNRIGFFRGKEIPGRDAEVRPIFIMRDYTHPI